MLHYASCAERCCRIPQRPGIRVATAGLRAGHARTGRGCGNDSTLRFQRHHRAMTFHRCQLHSTLRAPRSLPQSSARGTNTSPAYVETTTVHPCGRSTKHYASVCRSYWNASTRSSTGRCEADGEEASLAPRIRLARGGVGVALQRPPVRGRSLVRPQGQAPEPKWGTIGTCSSRLTVPSIQ